MLANAVLSIAVLLAGASDERDERERQKAQEARKAEEEQRRERVIEQLKFHILIIELRESKGEPERTAAILRAFRESFPDSPLGRFIRVGVLP
jgi:hypothetical protein